MRTFWVIALLSACPCISSGQWSTLSPLPDKEGFAGSFAGVSHGVILVAGGANFPDKKPWEGGRKFWYDTVFALDMATGKWRVAGKLPRPLGYGVSVTHENRVVCVGGSDENRHYPDVFRLEWLNDQLKTTRLPSLPFPVANACGAMVGNTLYLAGGQESPDATKTSKKVFRLNLVADNSQWETIESLPGSGRMLATATGFDGAFWITGGADLVVAKTGMIHRQYLNDAYRFDAGKGWKRIADLPYPVVAAPSPTPTDNYGFYILGGDDGSQIGIAPDQHRGFRRDILRFDLKSTSWVKTGDTVEPRVTVPCVMWGNSWIIPGGEVRPGVRSPEVFVFTPGKKH